MSSSTIDQQFVEFIVKTVVSNPDAVVIKRTIDEKGVLLELTVDPEDLGRVIGKRGSGAQALRTLLRALGTKNDARYNLKIVDVGERPERSRDDNRHNSDRHEQSTGSELSATDEKQPTEESIKDTPMESDGVAAEEVSSEEDASTADEVPEDDADSDGIAAKTRKELADLDDLDI